MEHDIIEEIPNFGPNDYQPFLSDIGKEEREDACLGGTQADTYERNIPEVLEVPEKESSPTPTLEVRSSIVTRSSRGNLQSINKILPSSPKEVDTQLGVSENLHENLYLEEDQVSSTIENGSCSKLNPRIRSRWGKEKDKHLIQTLREMEKEGRINIEEILELDPVFEAPFNSQMQEISVEIKWKGLVKSL